MATYIVVTVENEGNWPLDEQEVTKAFTDIGVTADKVSFYREEDDQ